MAPIDLDDRAERRSSRRKLQTNETHTLGDDSHNELFDVGLWTPEEVITFIIGFKLKP
jgi:hypothetical protein